MKKPKPPNSKEEVISYIRVKNLCVDPDFFWDFFSETEWYDSQGNPVLSWKQKLLTWHRKNIEKIRPHKCLEYGCRKPGVYLDGYDRDGHPYFRCVEHKPVQKPFIPSELKKNIFRPIPKEKNLNQKRNEAMEKLVCNEMEKRKHGK